MKSVVVITGGANGLGRELVAMLSPKHHVIVLDIDGHSLSRVAKKFSAQPFVCDISNWLAVESAIGEITQKYKKIDYLINCAGIYLQGQLTTNDPKKIKKVFEVNTLGTVNLCRFVTPIMKKQKSGTIINIISQAALYPCESRSVYHASKWAITGFTQCLQMDLSEQNISVTGIYPGLMKTALFQKQGVPRDLSHALELTEVANLIEYVINLSPDTLITDIGIKNIINPTNMDDNTSVPQIGLDINPDMITPQIGSPSLTPPTTTTDVPATPLPGVIDITPGASDQPQGTGHLADLIPQPITTPAPVAQITPDVPVTPPVILSVAEGSPSTIITPPTSPLAEDPDLVKLA